MARYKVKKMLKPRPARNASGDFGVWDSKSGQWVLNTEFVSGETANRIAQALNK